MEVAKGNNQRLSSPIMSGTTMKLIVDTTAPNSKRERPQLLRHVELETLGMRTKLITILINVMAKVAQPLTVVVTSLFVTTHTYLFGPRTTPMSVVLAPTRVSHANS